MKCFYGITVALLAICGAQAEAAASPAGPWRAVTSPHFELYTTDDDEAARHAVWQFERVQAFFAQTVTPAVEPQFPVRVIAFHSGSEYEAFRPAPGVFAYYLRALDHDYIVLGDLRREHLSAAAHEYSHLVAHQLHWRLPFWLDEGMAEFYASKQSDGNPDGWARFAESRLNLLRRNGLIPLAELTSARHQMEAYRDQPRMQQFYAESWAACALLRLGAPYRAGFPKFFRAVINGSSFEEALRSTYGQSLAEFESSLARQIESGQGWISPPMLSPVDEGKLCILQLSPGEFAPKLAALLGGLKRRSEAELILAGAQRQDLRTKIEVEECRGYLEWRDGNTDLARKHFLQAVELGSQNPRIWFHLSLLPNVVSDERRFLTQAVTLKPDYYEARFRLGVFDANHREPDGR